MNDFEREESNIDELEQIGEFKYFPAEDYNCDELLNDGLEEFKVKEIQSQSFVKHEETNIKKKNDSDELRKKLNNHLKTSLNSSASTSASALTTIAATVAIGTGLVGFSSTIDYGKLDFINYRVDTKLFYLEETEEVIKYKDIEIYFDENLNDGYLCNVLNKNTKEVLELDLEKDYVRFTNLELDIYDFEVQIIDSDSKVVESYDINVNTVCEYEFIEETSYEYTFTYNEDNTSNLYVKLDLEYEDINIYNSMVLLDEDGNELNYSSIDKDGVVLIEDIKEEYFSAITSSYYKKDGNYYLINRNYIYDFYPNKLHYDISADLYKLSISLYNEVSDNLVVNVKYLDDNTFEEFYVSKNIVNETQNIMLNLSKVSKSIEVTLAGKFILFEEIEAIKNTKGVYAKYIEDTQIVYPNIYNQVLLEKVEILNESYEYEPTTRLYFDGYLMEGSFLNVNVYDSNNNMIDSIKNIVNLSESVAFKNLDTTQIFKFEYEIVDNQGTQIFINQYETSVNIPSEYLNVDYTFNYINTGEVYLTYNDDKTFNVHFPVSFENRSEYDVVYKVEVMGFKDSGYVSFETISSNPMASILNLKSDMYYGVKYGVFIRDGINYYSIRDQIYPSGTFSLSFNEDGIVLGQNYITYEWLEEKKYLIDIYTGVYSDLDVELTFDNDKVVNINIPYSEITIEDAFSSFTLDLTAYEFTSVSLNIKGMMNDYMYREHLVDKDNIVGSGYTEHIYSLII